MPAAIPMTRIEPVQDEVPETPPAPEEQVPAGLSPEDFDPQALMQRFGVTPEQIKGWKAESVKVFGRELPMEAVALFGEFFIYRALTRAEHRQIMEQVASMGPGSKVQHEDRMVGACLVYSSVDPKALDATEAGVITVLAEHLAVLSKFGAPAQPLRL